MLWSVKLEINNLFDRSGYPGMSKNSGLIWSSGVCSSIIRDVVVLTKMNGELPDRPSIHTPEDPCCSLFY